MTLSSKNRLVRTRVRTFIYGFHMIALEHGRHHHCLGGLQILAIRHPASKNPLHDLAFAGYIFGICPSLPVQESCPTMEAHVVARYDGKFTGTGKLEQVSTCFSVFANIQQKKVAFSYARSV